MHYEKDRWGCDLFAQLQSISINQSIKYLNEVSMRCVYIRICSHTQVSLPLSLCVSVCVCVCVCVCVGFELVLVINLRVCVCVCVGVGVWGGVCVGCRYSFICSP